MEKDQRKLEDISDAIASACKEFNEYKKGNGLGKIISNDVVDEYLLGICERHNAPFQIVKKILMVERPIAINRYSPHGKNTLRRRKLLHWARKSLKAGTYIQDNYFFKKWAKSVGGSIEDFVAALKIATEEQLEELDEIRKEVRMKKTV